MRCALVLFTLVLFGWVHVPPGGAAEVFSTDFESGLPPEFSAPGAAIEPVQGYAGLGPDDRAFSGNFLRYTATDLVDTQLVLTDLPPHDSLTIGFLLAVIDSWDGTEVLEVSVDGATLFSHTFDLATTDTSSYVAPTDGLLFSGADLGFTGGTFHDHDRAYDLSVEPAFIAIPHTADSVTITWGVSATVGGGAPSWQGGADESWAIDTLTVEVEGGPTTTTTSTVTTTSTTTVTSTSLVTTTTSITTTTVPGTVLLPPGKKLLVKQKKSGMQRLQMLAKDATVTVTQPCESDGELVIAAVGAGAAVRRFPLEASLWKPIKAKRPERGCKYRKGPVVATVQIKAGKLLKVVAAADDLGVPLTDDPKPVRIEVRHGDVRHCLEFGGQGPFKAGKKLLAKNAGPAAGCPGAGSPSGAFLD